MDTTADRPRTQLISIATASADVGPTDLESNQGLTTTELDDLIWDIAVGRPTRVVLDTAEKRATANAVSNQINGAVDRRLPR
jgi:hypothetical protein